MYLPCGACICSIHLYREYWFSFLCIPGSPIWNIESFLIESVLPLRFSTHGKKNTVLIGNKELFVVSPDEHRTITAPNGIYQSGQSFV